MMPTPDRRRPPVHATPLGGAPTRVTPPTWAGPPTPPGSWGPTHAPPPTYAPPPTVHPDAPTGDDGGGRAPGPVPWAVLAAAAALAAGAATASAFGVLGRVADVLLVAAGLVLLVVPVGPLVRRDERAVSRRVAVVLCLALAAGGIATGYGLRGAVTTGPPSPAAAAPPAAASPGPAPAPPGPAAPAPVPATVALTDSRLVDVVVDDEGRLGYGQPPLAVADRELTDGFRTFCSCPTGRVEEGTLVVALGGEYRRLTAVLGADRGSPGTGAVQVTMRDQGSGRVLLDQPVDFTAATPIDLDVTGVQRLEIVARGPLGDVVAVVGEPRATG